MLSRISAGPLGDPGGRVGGGEEGRRDQRGRPRRRRPARRSSRRPRSLSRSSIAVYSSRARSCPSARTASATCSAPVGLASVTFSRHSDGRDQAVHDRPREPGVDDQELGPPRGRCAARGRSAGTRRGRRTPRSTDGQLVLPVVEGGRGDHPRGHVDLLEAAAQQQELPAVVADHGAAGDAGEQGAALPGPVQERVGPGGVELARRAAAARWC